MVGQAGQLRPALAARQAQALPAPELRPAGAPVPLAGPAVSGHKAGQQAKHPEVGDWPLVKHAAGMGQRPMKRSGTDPAFSTSRALGVFDAAAAVRLPPLPVRGLTNRYFFT